MISRRKVKGRAERGSFMAIPHVVMSHPDYINLSYKSKVLLFDLAFQFRGKNNGDLTAAPSVLRKRGWVRANTISDAIKELIEANLIIRTREGRFMNPHSRCALYALTWHQIDECYNKDLDVCPTTSPNRRFTKNGKMCL